MNSVKYFVVFAMVFATSLFASANTVTGVMMVVKGDIKVTSADGKTEAAKVGKKVTSGDTIVAGADSRAKIVMADKNVINISPDSKIVIEKYENDGKDKKNVELNVLYGKVRASVEQKYDGDKSKFNVKTPSAVAGVRGTDFLTGFNPQTKAASFITFSGSVAVGQLGPGGTIKNPVFVQAGQTLSVAIGQQIAPPKQLDTNELKQQDGESAADKGPGDRGPSSSGSSLVTESDKKGEKKNERGGNSGPNKPEVVIITNLGPCGPRACPPPPPTPPTIRMPSKVNIILAPQ